MPSVNNKRIAKNTIMLYIRMILLMAVSLYTSRVILKYLGVDDFGIYTLIGGFISLFSIITGSLVAATQRYFNVALGKEEDGYYNKLYCTSINIFIIISLAVVLIGETVGLWFVKTQLNIPEGRETAAMWVYQLSLLTTIVNLFRIPDNASIIAYEKMDFYAYVSIGEALLKLLIVFALAVLDTDKLILYVWLYLGTTVFINIVYRVYCKINFSTTEYHIFWDSTLFKDFMSFSGWTLLRQCTSVGKTQAENFFLNHYYAVSVNAARGVAMQVYNAVNAFTVNFQTAFKPQLVQSYASGNMSEHYNLLYRSSKFSYYLLLLVVIPISFNMQPLLEVWLDTVPIYTKEFCLYIFVAYLFDALGSALEISVFANGKIKSLQILTASLFVVGASSSFVMLKMGLPPYVVSIVTMFIHAVMFILDLFFVHKLCDVSISQFLNKVMLPVVLVTIFSVIVPFLVMPYSTGFWSTLGMCFIDLGFTLLSIWIFGLQKEEKRYVSSNFVSKIRFFGGSHGL